jgi:uncharacterized damage-inducible protein DinB
MREVDRIIDQLKRSVDGGAWHGPALLELLEGVTATQAAARPPSGAHTIWEIVHHCTVWMGQISLRLHGNTEKDLPPDKDWPPHPSSVDDQSWQATISRLRKAHQALAEEISGIADTRMDQPILEGFSSVYATLHGVIQHNLYHAGQIAVIKKIS